MGVKCEVMRCGDPYNSPGVMAAHIVKDHGSTPSIAFVNARRMFGYSTEPPVRVTFPPFVSGVRRGEHTSGPVTADAGLAGGGQSSAGVARDLRDRRASSSAQLLPGAGLNPARQTRGPRHPCIYCARLAPDRCKHHGGVSHSSWFTRKDASTCHLCARMVAKDGQPCKRHGGPGRGTSARQVRDARAVPA